MGGKNEDESMYDREPLGRRVVIKQQRKAHGGQGTERSGNTGKIGILYITKNGVEVEHMQCRAWTYAHVQKKLRATNLIPTDVALKHPGETSF